MNAKQRKSHPMNWGQGLYGNPCRECGYDWSITPEEALVLMATIPTRYAALLGESDGAQRHPTLGAIVL